MAGKPGSVSDSYSSGTPVAERLKQPTRIRRGPRQRIPIRSCSRWGLHCRPCYQGRGALLPHHFTLTCWKQAVYFLLHWPSAHAAQVLPGTSPCGARTFLDIPMDTATAWPTPNSRLMDSCGNYNLFTLPTVAFSFPVFGCIIQPCANPP